MKKFISILSVYLAFLFLPNLSAQSTTSGLSGDALANIIAGAGISITNVTLNCPTNSSGSFDDGLLSVIQLDEGVLLTSGNLNGIFGPNNAGNTSIDNGGGMDAELTAASGFATFNACVLEFKFVPSANNLSVDYVFASEEYNEWVCTQFNDVFAFFVTGPNPGGGNYTNQNIALVPGVGSPVTINSINNGSPGANMTEVLAICQIQAFTMITREADRCCMMVTLLY